MSNLWQDVRYAARTLRKAPGFTAAAALVLAIGIGATSAIFSLVDAVLLRPLPFPQPDRLVMLWEAAPGTPGNPHHRVSPLNFFDWSTQNRSFTAITAVAGGRRTLIGPDGTPEQIAGQSVSTTFFDVLGVRPIAGRTFVEADNAAASSVIVISERFWERRFGRDPTLVGRAITLDERPVTVIGIVPASFEILYPAEMWTPFVVRPSPEQRKIHFLQVLGRLKPDVALDRARADMRIIGEGLSRSWPETNKGWSVTVEPLQQAIVGPDLRTTSLVLGGVVAFVLLMACANVANLMLARGLGRRRDIAVRAALGGSRGRLVRQLVTESVCLAALGGLAGLALGWLAVRVAPSILPAGTLPPAIALHIDARVALFAFAITLVTGVLFGLAPAWQATRVSLTEAMGSGARTVSRGAGTLRAALVIGQMAAAVLLVSGAGLLLRTLISLNHVDTGFRADRVLTMTLDLSTTKFRTQERALAFFQQVEREVEALPGIRAVSFAGALPLEGWNVGQGFSIDGEGLSRVRGAAHYQMIGTRYFDVLGIGLVRGRAFTERDTAAAPQVCIVNEEFVRKYLDGRDPIGARVSVESMQMKGPTPVIREIVGVMRQVKVDGPGEKERSVEIYVPLAQNTWFWSILVAQTDGEPLASVPAVKAAIARVDPRQPVRRVRTMEDVVAQSVAAPRFRAELVGTFAIVALVLAAVGIFGVLAVSVNQRRREFGVRMALGARTPDVMRLVIGGGLWMVGAGVALGLIASAVMTRALTTLLFGVVPLDPLTFAIAPVVLTMIGLIACVVPALRAARVDPAVTLRQE